MTLLIANDRPLPPEWLDHAVTGDWVGHRECHVGGNFLLIYTLDDSGKSGLVVFVRSGTNSELFQRTAPHEAIRQTLLLGGNTDTNACIVAGLCGALHGASALPDHWIPTMACVDLNRDRTRPDWCKATNLSERVAKAMGVTP